MTVGELIGVLSAVDKDKDVVIQYPGTYQWYYRRDFEPRETATRITLYVA